MWKWSLPILCLTSVIKIVYDCEDSRLSRLFMSVQLMVNSLHMASHPCVPLQLATTHSSSKLLLSSLVFTRSIQPPPSSLLLGCHHYLEWAASGYAGLETEAEVTGWAWLVTGLVGGPWPERATHLPNLATEIREVSRPKIASENIKGSTGIPGLQRDSFTVTRQTAGDPHWEELLDLSAGRKKDWAHIYRWEFVLIFKTFKT